MSDAPAEGAVTVAYVHSNDCTMSWHHSIIEMLAYDMAHEGRVLRGGWVAIHSGTDGLVESRNMAVKTFLAEKKADWLFWVDTDMGFAADALERLLEAADPGARPIVGALCFSLREIGPDGMGGYRTRLTPTIFDWTKEKEKYGYAVRWQFPPQTLVRCSGTGSACILIHRSVFERIEREHGPVWYDRVPNTTTGQLISEDLSFCLRAGALGIPLHIHTGVEASHAKLNWLANEQYQEQLVAEAYAKRTERPEAPTAVIVPVLGRPQNASPFMESLRQSAKAAHVYAVVGPEETLKGTRASERAWKRAGATVLRCGGATFAEKVNHAYRETSEPFLFLVGDDVRFHPGWLAQAQAQEAGVVGTNDLCNPRVLRGEHTCHPLIRRSYVEERGASWDGPGVVAHEGYRHWYVDDEIVTAAKQRGEWKMAPDAVVEHLHPLFGKGKLDATYQLGWSKAEADKQLFEERLQQNLAELLEAHA